MNHRREDLLEEQKTHLNTQLLHAAAVGDCQAINDCMQRGADVHFIGSHNLILAKMFNFPLAVACKGGHYDAVVLLIDKYHADVNYTTREADGRGISLLHYVTWCPMNPRQNRCHIIEAIVDRGANINALGPFGTTPLGRACAIENPYQWEHAKCLVRKGANVCIQDDDGYAPLFYAIQFANRDMVKFLLSHGANIIFCGNSNCNMGSAADVADRFGHLELATTLHNTTRIVHACQKGDKDLIKSLLSLSSEQQGSDGENEKIFVNVSLPDVGKTLFQYVCDSNNSGDNMHEAVISLVRDDAVYPSKDGSTHYWHVPLVLNVLKKARINLLHD